MLQREASRPMDGPSQGWCRPNSLKDRVTIPYGSRVFRVAIGIVGGVLAIAALTQFGLTLATDRNIQWDVIGFYIFSPQIIEGVGVTLKLTLLAQSIGTGLGVVLALMRLAPSRVLRGASGVYLWLSRGIPTLVQLIFWYNLGLVFRQISLGIPFGPTLFHAQTQRVITATGAAILGLSLTEAGFMAEIVRSSIQSVDVGQRDAARALGMTPWTTMRRIVLPQALPVAIPPTANQLINMLKLTSLVSVIGAEDLLTRTEFISSQNFDVLELMIVAAIWYLALTNVAMFAERWLERRLNRSRIQRPGLEQRALRDTLEPS